MLPNHDESEATSGCSRPVRPRASVMLLAATGGVLAVLIAGWVIGNELIYRRLVHDGLVLHSLSTSGVGIDTFSRALADVEAGVRRVGGHRSGALDDPFHHWQAAIWAWGRDLRQSWMYANNPVDRARMERHLKAAKCRRHGIRKQPNPPNDLGAKIDLMEVASDQLACATEDLFQELGIASSWIK